MSADAPQLSCSSRDEARRSAANIVKLPSYCVSRNQISGIVQPDAKDAVGVLALGPAKRAINDANVGRALTLLLGHAKFPV